MASYPIQHYRKAEGTKTDLLRPDFTAVNQANPVVLPGFTKVTVFGWH